jgi:hypothetical protein
MASPSTFYADDKFFDVVRCLEARGWKRAPVDSHASTLALRWRNLSSLVHERFFVRCGRATFVNHFEGAQCLSNKGSLTALLAGLDSGRGAPCYPRCHALSGRGPSSVDAASGKGANAEANPALVAALAGTLRDVGTQLAVGALRELLGALSVSEDGPREGVTFASPAMAAGLDEVDLDLTLLFLCVGIAERWANQLEKLLSLPSTPTPTTIKSEKSSSRSRYSSSSSSSSSKLSSSGKNKLGAMSRAPSKAVLSVGSQEWAALVAPGGTVLDLARALRGNRNHEKRSTADTEDGSSRRSSSNSSSPGTTRRSAAVDTVLTAAKTVLRRLAALDVHFGLGGSGVWIVKPSGLSCGRGIVCVNSVADVAAAIAGLDYKAVVQKWVESNSSHSYSSFLEKLREMSGFLGLHNSHVFPSQLVSVEQFFRLIILTSSFFQCT